LVSSVRVMACDGYTLQLPSRIPHNWQNRMT
jgi:hypothetical protein